MKTLQEKYIGTLKEEFSKKQFKRDAVLEFPQYVTTHNSFDNVVSILKQKGIISEVSRQRGMSYEKAIHHAKQTSAAEDVVQHVNQLDDSSYEVSDWYDADNTIASFESGRELTEQGLEEIGQSPPNLDDTAKKQAWWDKNKSTMQNLFGVDSFKELMRALGNASQVHREGEVKEGFKQSSSLLNYEKLGVSEEIDNINNPVLIKIRADKMKAAKMKAANAGGDGNDKFFAKNAKRLSQLKALKDKRAEIMRDMEQEAEIEGGPIADRYGDLLNKIDAAIAKLEGQGKGDEYMSKGEIERRAAMIKEMSGDKMEALMELRNILDELQVLGDQARNIIGNNFPTFLRKGEAYGAFDMGSSVNRYDTTLASIVDEIEEEDEDMMQEDLDLGHQDDEPGMLKGDLYRIGKYAMELYQMMDSLEDMGDVDFPHWWQSKIIKAKDMVVSAKHYLDFELKEPHIDTMVDVAQDVEAREYSDIRRVNGGARDYFEESVKEGAMSKFTDYSNNELAAYARELSKQRADAASKGQSDLLSGINKEIEAATRELKKRSQALKGLTRTDVNEQADHVAPMVVKAYKEYLEAKKEGDGEKAYRYYSKKLNNTYSTRADRDAIEAILKKKYGSALEESVKEIKGFKTKEDAKKFADEKNSLAESLNEESTTFKKDDKVTYLSYPAEITFVGKDQRGRIYYSVSYDKGNGKTKASNLYNKDGEITRNGTKGTLKEAMEKYKEEKVNKYEPKVDEVDKYSFEDVKRGIMFELEKMGVNTLNTPTKEEFEQAKLKALKELGKNRLHYLNILAGESDGTDKHDQMIPVKKDNHVDTYNGMQKIQIKEAVKKIVKKAFPFEIEQLVSEDVNEVRRRQKMWEVGRAYPGFGRAIKVEGDRGKVSVTFHNDRVHEFELSEEGLWGIVEGQETPLRKTHRESDPKYFTLGRNLMKKISSDTYDDFTDSNVRLDKLYHVMSSIQRGMSVELESIATDTAPNAGAAPDELRENKIKEVNVSADHMDRMDGLSSIKAQEALVKAAQQIFDDLEEEMFEDDEIYEFIKYKIRQHVYGNQAQKILSQPSKLKERDGASAQMGASAASGLEELIKLIKKASKSQGVKKVKDILQAMADGSGQALAKETYTNDKQSK